MRYHILTIVLALIVSGCTSTKMALTEVDNKYINKSLDEFVLKHGVPFNAYELQDDSFMYDWSSGIDSLRMPETINHSGSINEFGFYAGTSRISGGGSWDLECVLRILTDKQKKIKSISIQKDTWGHWETSRCHEIFGK